MKANTRTSSFEKRKGLIVRSAGSETVGEAQIYLSDEDFGLQLKEGAGEFLHIYRLH